MEIRVEGIKKAYKAKMALDDVSFTLFNGVYGLLGPNGAGKSTLMNIIVGILPQDEGRVFWNNEDIRKLGKAYREVLGYVPQQQTLYPEFTAAEFLGYICVLQGIPKTEQRERIDTVLRQVLLEEVRNYRIKTFSGGMKQRLLIAQALLSRPQFLVLDEPTAGLDPKQRIYIRNLMAELGKESIVLIATHVVSDVDKIADEILFLDGGHLIEKDTPANLILRYQRAEHSGQVSSLEDIYLHFYGEDTLEDVGI